jgi:quercetin dioxygenase-like cupin family protein
MARLTPATLPESVDVVDRTIAVGHSARSREARFSECPMARPLRIARLCVLPPRVQASPAGADRPQSVDRYRCGKLSDTVSAFQLENQVSIMTTILTENVANTPALAFARGRKSLADSIWYAGSLMTFLATSEETRGQFALIEQVGRKGNVPPRHLHHHEDEAFYLLEGEMTFLVGEQTIKATPGMMIFAPRGIAHSFTIDTDQVRFLVLITPGGFEAFFGACGVPAAAMTLPPSADVSASEIQKTRALVPSFGVEFVAPRK